jgi:hypothetical protein
MEYNTQRKKMVLPEYGRNIQLMVDHALKIEDREERNRMAKAIITIMGNMHPHLRDITDFKHKLWDHLAIMSDFKLDIDSPYPPPSIETLTERPKRVPYSLNEPRYKYYGKIIEQLIQKAAEMEDGEVKEALIEIIANHMKKTYIMWNKDTVTDDIIFDTIKELSSDKIDVNADLKLSAHRDIMKKTQRKRTKKTENHSRRSDQYRKRN